MAIDDLRARDWLLLPGTLCTGAVFTGFLDALDIPPERRKPLRVDRPAVEDYATSLTAQAEGAVLCGFSLGAIVAAHCADRIKADRVILFGLNPYADDPAKAAGRYELERDVRDLGGAAALASRLPALGGPAPDKARAAILAMAEDSAGDIAAQTRLALTRPGAQTALSRSRAPVMMLTGSVDSMVSPDMGRAAAQMAPLGRFAALPGLGHYALLEDPKLCAQSLLELTAQHS